jgi:hypothetical protein
MNIGFKLPEIEMPLCLIRRIMYRQAFCAALRTDEFPTPLEVHLYMQLPCAPSNTISSMNTGSAIPNAIPNSLFPLITTLAIILPCFFTHSI